MDNGVVEKQNVPSLKPSPPPPLPLAIVVVWVEVVGWKCKGGVSGSIDVLERVW